MDRIIISDLTVFYCVGVTDAERRQPQRLLLTVEFEHDFSTAARTDDLAATIDYYAASQRLLHFGEGRSWRLIETLAVDLANLLLGEFGPAAVTVRVKKFVIPEADHVSVCVKRISAAPAN
ncbi:MAG: dihydroneopterin aldolase [Limisphaerales bacterium]